MTEIEYPMRINKYIAHKKYCTRREADTLIEAGKVLLNGKRAQLGDKVQETDTVEVRYRPQKFRYFAYHKPKGVITHSAQDDEEEIADAIDLKGVFPVGRLDKDSYGLIILTDDGRLTDALLNPDHDHEKEYEVTLALKPPSNFKRLMEKGIDIGGYVTKPCTLAMRGEKKFSIVLTEGKKHQVRRMCGALGQSVVALKRVRIMQIGLNSLPSGAYRELEGDELKTFLGALGITK